MAILCCISIAATSINREVLRCLIPHGKHLVLLVITQHLYPCVNLLGTPKHTIDFKEVGVVVCNLRRNDFVVLVITRLTEINGIGIHPSDIETIVAIVDIVLGVVLGSHLYEVITTHVLPFRNHHDFDFILRVFEGSGNGVTHTKGIFELNNIFACLLIFVDEEVTTWAHQEIGGQANENVTCTAHVRIGRTSGHVLHRGHHIDFVVVVGIFP